ncbi:MAG: hypothetical protein ACE5IJ_03895 [Thermoplasmata archaeon]
MLREARPRILRLSDLLFRRLLLTLALLLVYEVAVPKGVTFLLDLRAYTVVTGLVGLPSHPGVALSLMGSLLVWSWTDSSILGMGLSGLTGLLVYLFSRTVVSSESD